MGRQEIFPNREAVRPLTARTPVLLDTADAAGPVIKTILSTVKPSAPSDPLALCLQLIQGTGPKLAQDALATLSPAWRDHAIASAYAVLMPEGRRKRLGAYFTPPHLVNHLVDRLKAFGLDLRQDRVRDPAAGGAAFLVPLARRKVALWREAGENDRKIVEMLSTQLRGGEIDPGLARLANALLKRMLTDEFGLIRDLVGDLEIVVTGDSLAATSAVTSEIDHEIGNPPYLRLPRSLEPDRQAEFDDISNGRLNLYAMFLRRALDHVPPGGLVGYVIPASFLGGPEFRAFRAKIVELAEVLVVDLIEKRSDVFQDATQDACFVVLRRRTAPLPDDLDLSASSGLLEGNGGFRALGKATVQRAGAPWRLPGAELAGSATLSTWGYRATIGYLVANRQPERLHVQPGPDRYPLIWAKAISPEGVFDFGRGLEHKKSGWVDAPDTAPYIVRTECVAIQRTSSRGQRRRLTAAAISGDFVEKHGGIVAENHVILLVPTRPDAVSSAVLANALNDATVSEELDRVCGSASISARLLESLRLPDPP
ncbi:MAG TPA: N-6 DNA methylase [Phenylobacterium sp.]|uniref:Eco57I restriction-modification methylase domain-containing protein n=1 Tax=Phenylobacterium sp. TaxID=1871053 RepID=UPI002F923083